VVREAELQAEGRGQRLEDAAAGGDDFAANAVTRDETCKGVSISFYGTISSH
jgi:hypothetical protein